MITKNTMFSSKEFLPLQGGVTIRIIFALTSLVLVGLATTWVISRYQKEQMENNRKAYAIADYGLQIAMQKLNKNPSWDQGLPKTSYNGGWYVVNMSKHRRGEKTVLTIEAEGHCGFISRKRELILVLNLQQEGDSIWIVESSK